MAVIGLGTIIIGPPAIIMGGGLFVEMGTIFPKVVISACLLIGVGLFAPALHSLNKPVAEEKSVTGDDEKRT